MSASGQGGAGPRVGIVGAGRTRQGLGPFLARWFERGGARIHGVCGRDAGRGRAAAAGLATKLGHDVRAYPDADALARSVDLLVVACPVEGHLAGLDAALAAGVPCLCEKPLTSWRDAEAGLERVAAFRRRGLLLAENCQWPFALPALAALHPEALHPEALPSEALPPGPLHPGLRSLEMRLSPSQPGRAMVEDSLSHVLSLLQALVPLPPEARVRDVSREDGCDDATRDVVRFRVVSGARGVDVALHLEVCPEQPRPAWFAVDGVRLDRQIGADYEISFRAADGRTAKVEDPLAALVYGLLYDLSRDDRARTESLADALALRLRLYAGVLGGLERREGT